MRNDRDTSVIERMIKYCEDVEVLLERFDRSFDNYTNDISFQYGVEISVKILSVEKINKKMRVIVSL